MTDGDTADDLLQAPWDTVSDAEDADESVPEVIDDKALVEFFSDELGKSAAEVKKLREENIWLNGQLAMSELEQKVMVDKLVQENREIASELFEVKDALANFRAQANSTKAELAQTLEQVALLATQLARSAGVKLKRKPANSPILASAALEELKEVLGRLTNRNKAVSVAVQAAPAPKTHRALHRNDLSSFRSALSATLSAAPEGYDNLKTLLKDLIEDSGEDGAEAARSFGYASFAQLLVSAEMSPVVCVRFKAKATPDNAHILQEQEEANAHWAEQYRKTKALLDRKSAEARQLHERNRVLQAEVHDAEERLRATREQLRHYEKAFECLCMESCVEVIYGCGHGCCTKCDERWTKRDAEGERPVDPAARFRPKAGMPLVYGTGPPTCPRCRTVITARTRVY
ncbi:hypothetical protein AAVH_09356 [Aphelenchoides avenae]|nr:hypothetical protein AAVH_09356 [Aphelenchus avenae]